MKVTTPHSVPDGDSESAGMRVSAAAEKNAASVEVSVSMPSESGFTVAEAGAAGWTPAL